jgi:hypothetical protein
MTEPEWLTRRGGKLKMASDGNTRFVVLGGQPEYTVVPRPVANQWGCFIKQTNSGRPIPSSSTAPGEDQALAAGLEELRQYLGW